MVRPMSLPLFCADFCHLPGQSKAAAIIPYGTVAPTRSHRDLALLCGRSGMAPALFFEPGRSQLRTQMSTAFSCTC